MSDKSERNKKIRRTLWRGLHFAIRFTLASMVYLGNNVPIWLLRVIRNAHKTMGPPR